MNNKVPYCVWIVFGLIGALLAIAFIPTLVGLVGGFLAGDVILWIFTS